MSRSPRSKPSSPSSFHAGAQQNHRGLPASDADAGVKFRLREVTGPDLNQFYQKDYLAQRIWIAGRRCRRDRRYHGVRAVESGARFQAACSQASPRRMRARCSPSCANRASTTGWRITVPRSGPFGPGGGVAHCKWPSAGLPKSGRIGFELFDKANFGASEFAEQVNYHRAIEGELERSHHVDPRGGTGAGPHHYGQGFALHRAAPARQSERSGEAAPCGCAFAAKRRGHLPADGQRGAGIVAEQVSLVDTSGNLLNRPRPASVATATDSVKPRSNTARASSRTCKTRSPRRSSRCWARIIFARGFRRRRSDQRGPKRGDFDPAEIGDGDVSKDAGRSSAALRVGHPGNRVECPNPASKPVTGIEQLCSPHRERHVPDQPDSEAHRLPQGTVKRLSLSVLVDHTVRWEGRVTN